MTHKVFCKEEGCEKKAKVLLHELCRAHYLKYYRGGVLPKAGTCSIVNCEGRERFRGLCIPHRDAQYPDLFSPRKYPSRYTNPDGTPVKCKIERCEKDAKRNEMCLKHNSRERRRQEGWTDSNPNNDIDGFRKTCSAESVVCESPAVLKGFCRLHWDRIKNHGTASLPKTKTCPVTGCGRDMMSKSTICKRCNQFRWRYSLTIEQVIGFWKPENYKCSNESCEIGGTLHMDHAHSCCPPGSFERTSKVSCGNCVRGWLCRSCNLALGKLQENPRRIQGLLDYLEKSLN